MRHLLAGDPLHEMQAAFLFFALAGMPIPSMKVTALRDLGPAGTEAKPTLSTTFDLVLSSNGAQQPMRSHHIAPRPCMNVVRHAFHLKPMFLGGPHSFVILWWCFPASDRRRGVGQQNLTVRGHGFLVPTEQDVVVEHDVGVLQAVSTEALDLLRRICERGPCTSMRRWPVS